MMAVGVIVWVLIAVVASVRLGLGLDHLSRDQIVPGIIGGICGGWGARLRAQADEEEVAQSRWAEERR